MSNARVWKVLIADDDDLVCEALRDLVASDHDFTVVATAHDAEEAIELALEFQPDVAIVDVRMPKGGGVRVANYLAASSPDIKIVGLSAEIDSATERSMLAAGAVKYLTKGVIGGQLLDILRELTAGGRSR
jgi:DNA-binding NarL/FixJ family response regulator